MPSDPTDPEGVAEPFDLQVEADLLELLRATRDCLGSLDPGDREVYQIRFEAGKTGRQAAKQLGVPESTFRERLLPRLLRRLARCLATKGFDELPPDVGARRRGTQISG